MGFYQNYHIRKIIGRGKDIGLNLHREQLQKQTVSFVKKMTILTFVGKLKDLVKFNFSINFQASLQIQAIGKFS